MSKVNNVEMTEADKKALEKNKKQPVEFHETIGESIKKTELFGVSIGAIGEIVGGALMLCAAKVLADAIKGGITVTVKEEKDEH